MRGETHVLVPLFSTINPKEIDPELNLSLRGERPGSNRLSHGMKLILITYENAVRTTHRKSSVHYKDKPVNAI